MERFISWTLEGSPILAQILAFAVLVPCAGIPDSLHAQALNREDNLPFLTLRNDTGSDKRDKVFGDERSRPKAGWCKTRELVFDLLSPLANQAPAYIQEEFVRVESIDRASRETVLDALEASAEGRPPLLYTHGYNISFEKGCRRAARLQENAGLSGRMLWFSWPSDGALTNYTHDEADLYWSIPDIASAIMELEKRFGHDEINVAGHSLGARGLVLALSEVANRNPDVRIGELVLLAPDMDFEIFVRILPRIQRVVENITVYVTSEDRPLALSAQLHGYPRLGEAGNDVSTLIGVDVIDLSDLPSDSPTGHLYHIYSEDVGADLSQLLNEGKQPGQRRRMVQLSDNRWKLLPTTHAEE